MRCKNVLVGWVGENGVCATRSWNATDCRSELSIWLNAIAADDSTTVRSPQESFARPVERDVGRVGRNICGAEMLKKYSKGSEAKE